MNKVKIENVDKNFKVEKKELKLKWIDPKESNDVKVYGLPWFYIDKRYHRLPRVSDEIVKNLIGSVDVLAANTSGGLIAFRSNTKNLKIKVKLSYMFHMGHMPYTGQAGFDLYLGQNLKDLKFYRVTNFDFSNYEYEYTFYTNLNHDELHVLNFPLYASVDSVEIGIDEDAIITPENSLYNNEEKILFYGTSITQGGCASRPGMSYTQKLSRTLGIECLNYGFSGNGRGHEEIAEILTSLENIKMFVLCFEANATLPTMKENLPKFYKHIRKNYPFVPILLVSKIRFFDENHGEAIKNEKIYRGWEKAYVKKCEDENFYYLDGRKLLEKDYHEKTVDGVHPNDYGFASIERVMRKEIKKILKIEE